MYEKQSVVILEDMSGFPVAYRTRQAAEKLESELELAGIVDRKSTLKVQMLDATLISREVSADQVTVCIQIDEFCI